MTTHALPKDKSLSRFLAQSQLVDKVCRDLLLNKLKEITTGLITIQDQLATQTFGDPNSSLACEITVHKLSFYSRSVLGGSIGNAESYVDGDWDTNNLTNLIRIFVLNRKIIDGIDNGLGKLLQPFQKIIHIKKNNTIEGSKSNIKAHYDIGNDFFKLFLDETMMYSSAVFENANTTLRDASNKKIELICERLQLKSTDKVIEIGTGWGSLAIFAAQKYGCHVTTTTISKEQFDYATERVKALGLEDKIQILFEDYRKLEGQFDKLVSVEMIEAVGLNHLDTYFKKCSSLLKPDGLMVIQAITIRDQYYEKAKNSVDFIQRHIFPGSGIPAIHALLNSMTTQSDLILINSQDYAEDYAQTLKIWSENLSKEQHSITKLGYPEFLYRLWQYYFAYCEGGFRERAIGVSQLTFAKPQYKNRSYV